MFGCYTTLVQLQGSTLPWPVGTLALEPMCKLVTIMHNTSHANKTT